MISSIFQPSDALFDEVAIADLNAFQLAVLTTTQITYQPFSRSELPVSVRHYQQEGWLICDYQVIAHFEKLAIGLEVSDEGTVHPSRQIAASVPLSFEVKSRHPLPAQLLSQATVTEKSPEADAPYRSIFQQLQPRFVRTYALGNTFSLLERVERMLAAKTAFIAQNYDYLKQQPFYQAHFGL